MKLSICIVVKDRSKVPTKDGYLYLLPKCIESISNYHSPEQIEVVICDFHSKDWPLEEWIDDYKGEVDVNIVKADGDFSLGRGRNIAANNAKYNVLLFLDADCLIDDSAIDTGLYYTHNDLTCFPFISFIGKEGEISQGNVLNNGSGVCFITRDVFFSTSGWPEFKSWGGEDDIFANLINKRHKKRYYEKGIKHQWHPSEISQIHYKNKMLSDYANYIKGKNSTKDNIEPTHKKVVESLKNKITSINESVDRKEESILVISKFTKQPIPNIDSFDKVVRCDMHPTINYEKIVGEKTTHTFRDSTFNPQIQIQIVDDKRISEEDEYEMPLTIYGYLRGLPSNNYCRTVSSEFVISIWLLLFYNKVHLAGHFTDHNNEKEVITYYGAQYNSTRLEISNELEFLKKLENKIILL